MADAEFDVNELMNRPEAAQDEPLARAIVTFTDYVNRVADAVIEDALAEHLLRWHRHDDGQHVSRVQEVEIISDRLAGPNAAIRDRVRTAFESHEQQRHT